MCTHTHHNTVHWVDWNKDPPATSHFRRFRKRNCNKFIQKKLNQLQTGQQTRWQGGNRGVSKKKQSYVWHAAKLWQSYAWIWRKNREIPLVLVRLGTAANGTMKTLLLCLWHFQRVSGSKDTLGLAWRNSWVWSSSGSGCRGSEIMSFRPLWGEARGGKRNHSSCETWWEKTGKTFCSPSERSY